MHARFLLIALVLSLLAPNVAAGCTSDYDCGSLQYCDDNGYCCGFSECNEYALCPTGFCNETTNDCCRACSITGETCTLSSDCCYGKCYNGACCWSEVGQACSSSDDCCGNACENGHCKDTMYVCSHLDGPCGIHKSCCEGEGLTCDPGTQTCILAEPEPGGDGAPCTSGTDCLSGICCGGSCAFCCEIGVGCSGGDCCGDLSCEGGSCCTSAPGYLCFGEEYCCGDLTCRDNQCCYPENTGPCNPQGDDCCGNLVCNPLDFLCQNVQIYCVNVTGDYCDDLYQQCCEGMTCIDNACCNDLNQDCSLHSDCCSGNCSGNLCAPSSSGCSGSFETCSSNDDCCGVLLCGTDGRCHVEALNCLADGHLCNSSVECCSGNCVNGHCAPEGAVNCSGNGETCSDDSDCCSGLCDNGICGVSALPLCKANGDLCVIGAECCSNYCSGGFCAAFPTSTCRGTGQVCYVNTECCSFNCNNNVCGPALGCKSVGQNCTTGLECCTGYCKNSVCSLNCKSTGDNCSESSECCTGYCESSLCMERETCVSSGGSCANDYECCPGYACLNSVCGVLGHCKVNGEACTAPSQCCSGSCKNYKCAAPANCRGIGQSCSLTGECCSGLCLNYVCNDAPECKALEEECYSNSECCSGRCRGYVCVNNVEIRFVEVQGDRTSFKVGESGSFRAVAVDENGKKGGISAVWELDGSIGELLPIAGEEVDFTAKRVGVGVVRINYREGAKSFSNVLPISVVPGDVVKIGISPPATVVYSGDTVYFTVQGYDAENNIVSISSKEVQWNAEEGVINEKGVFMAPSEKGNLSVSASYGGFKASADIEVLPRAAENEIPWDEIFAVIGKVVLGVMGGLLALFALIYGIRKVMQGMERKFDMPDIPPGSSVLLEAPPESSFESNVYKVMNTVLGSGGRALVLSLSPEGSVALMNKHLERMDNVKVVGVEPDLTKVGIKLSEVLEKEQFGVVYFSFFGKSALTEEADTVADFIEFNMLKLVKGNAIGLFPLELNEKLTSEFISKLEMNADVVVEHRVTDREYARVKQFKGREFEKRWLPF